MVALVRLESPLGPLIAGSTDEAVCLLEFAGDDGLEGRLAALRQRLGAPLEFARNPLNDALSVQLDEYFRRARRTFDLPLAYPGTEFQRRVWSALLEIPYAATRSYQDIARQVGSPRAVRAVGRSNGMNRIAIVIPCHRVVNAGGTLGGYSGGLWRKQHLLDLERGDRLL